MVKQNNEIKFIFEIKYMNKNSIDKSFNKFKSLNIRFNENLKPYCTDNKIIYEYDDVSQLNKKDLETKINSFFSFTFKDITNTDLYKFLVLKNKDKLTILANIHPLIFDYTSINSFYNIFNNNNFSLKNLITHHHNLDKYLNSNDFKKDSDFWENNLSNSEDYVKFYNIGSNNYKNIKIPLNQIKDNKFNFITGIFSLYLSRINQSKGCLLKTSIPKNNHLDINTLLKIEYNEDISFNDFLNQVNDVYDSAIQHSRVNIENYTDYTCFYSVYDFTDLKNVEVVNGEGSALTLNIYEDYLELIYNADLFSNSYMEHMAANIKSLINSASELPNIMCKDIDILSDNEKKTISEFSKGKTIPFDKNTSFGKVFQSNAKKLADKLAIDDGVNQISYQELDSSSNSIANDLKENYGIGLDSIVALMLPRDYRFPELVLALNKIGAIFIPIDPSYPIKRIEHMLNIGKADFIITTEELLDESPFDVDIIYYGDLNLEDDCEFDLVQGSDFAILFTSGTTGLPKGVAHSNKQLIGTAVAFNNIFDSFDCDLIGCYASFSFILSFRIFWALYDGKSCRIFNDDERRDSLKLIEILKDNHFHDIILPPSLGIPILENENINLDYMVCCGSKLNALPESNDFTKIVNAYGMTEIMATANICNTAKNDNSIGKSMANTWAYILDKNNNLLPVGVPGEICISCDYLTPGYINSPELTKKVIVNNPYSDCEYNKLLYRTGDIGFYNSDGKIEIIGRKDDQLSVRGFRIESEEILKILERFENLKEIYLDTDNDNLIAYYTTFGDLSIDDIKFALEDELPQYMVPSIFIKLDKIPLNANGKIDKFELKKNIPELAEVEIDDGILSIVVNAFRDVLNCESVLIDDNFVGLGGNSLSAMNLQLILNNHLGVNLSSSELIELATPLKIANHVKFNLNSYSSLDVNYTFNDGCPLSESQLNVYLDEQVKKMDLIYNNPFKIKFNQNYSKNEIRSAIYKLFDLYPVLKAHVVNDGGDLSFIFDSEPEIKNGPINDLDSFVRPFNLGESLSRFLIIESESILCIDCHHLIFDGTSINVLVNSLLSILNNNAENIVDDGVLRQISYEESITSEYLDDARDFFDEMLAERDEVNDLLDSVNDDGENAYTDYFKMDLSSFLKDNSITYNQFFASVFAYTLSRFAGSDKIMFNLIEDGRGHVNLSDSVGMFVKTLPVLIDCENQDIESFIKYSSGLINSVMKYDLYSFRILVNDYDLNSDISFQYNHDLFNISGLEMEELEHDVFNDFNFLIQNNSNNNFEIKVQYSSKYSNEFIKRFVDSYKLILEGMLSHNKLNEINYIGSSDLTILDNYNQTEHDLFYNDIMDAFNDNLVKYPDNALVSYNNISYSYAEGAFIADKTRKLLIDFGVEPGDCVSFLVPRSELYMFCILGILSAGAIYVPLDDKLPDNRLSFILEDSDSHVVIASDETYDRVNSLCEGIILNISDLFNDDIGCLNYLPVVYGDLACILYTSGTTGVPKGVKITRKSIINVCEYYIAEYDLDDGDVYGMFSNIGFDVGNFAINVVMCAGACLNVIPEEIRFNILKLNDYFISHNVSHTYVTTQVGKLFMENVDKTSLDILLVGGEKLGNLIMPKDYHVIDAYGPTESFTFISLMDNNDKLDSSSVGFVNFNVKLYVLDEDLRRVPVGAVGELYIAGYQLADGYLNLDDETNHAFVSNPFNDGDYGVLYRTGDMVRFLPDGSLGIVGRRDSQVKIRGNRVELSEIEAVIHELDYVENVTVQTVKNGSNNELAAYVVSNNNDKKNIEEDIKAFVLDCKPDYMVPSYVVLLNSIPLTVNGKVDKDALPEVNFSSLVVEYVAPSNETEKQIVDAFEKVFNQNIGIYDDFIHLGGDSLTAIKLLTYLDGFNISAGDILSLRTPYAIANRVIDISFDLDIYSLDQGCPLNEPQLNVYLDIKANDKEGAYLIPLFMNISGEYSVDDIGSALGVMFDVHPVLGMCVSDDFDVPYLIKESEPSIIVESDVNNEFITQFLTEPFDLHDSLCRFLIVEEEGSFVIYAVFHHIIFDAISSDVFKRDLYTILGGGVVGVDDSFLKVSAFNQQIAESNEYTQAEVFYESMLADIDDTVELLDSVLADGPGSTSIELNMDNELFNSFLEKHNISENVLFSSVFAYTLSRFVGSEKILFNIVENGRDRFNNFDSVGMFVNTLPLLVDCKNQNVDSFMEYVSNVVYGVMRYNYYPFRLLVNKYDIKSNIIFQFLPGWVRDNNDSDDTIWDIDENDLLDNMGDLIADLSVEIIQRGNNYHLSVVYSDKYSSDFINRFVQSYKAILNDMLCVKALGDISYVSSDDLVLLDEFNNTEHDFPYDDVLDAFNTNLVKNPDKDLVTYMNRSYSYGEGAFIAAKIAKSLTDLGVESGDCVGFLVARSELYIFSVLGILSVGSVFVPLDDGLPNERLSYILGDSDCKVVIVSDETYNRADEISDCVLLNISNIINEDIGSLEYLPVVYGDLACILYTSGTTGVPKGVKNTRKSLINVSENYIEMHSLDENDVYGLYSAIGFDMSTFVIDVVITAGACLAVIPDEIKLDMLKLNDYFIDHNVSHAAIPTPVAKLFMKNVDDTSLDVLHIGGEKLGDFVCSEAYRVIDSYGPTESFAYVCSIDNSDKVDPSSVGFVNFNVKSYILDNDLRRVPVGAVGELYFGGYQLARGYLNRDEETNHAFVDNPYEDDEGFNRLYRTGDMGRFLPDGSIDIIGRRDTQVKIRGNRVELSEVESVIRNIDIVEDVTVQTLDNDGIRELIAYVVLSTDLDNIELLNSVCNYVAEHKPNYMVPSYVVKLDHIPLNVNGKVDKSALPNVDVASLSVEYVAPSNETEKAIVDAFEKAFSRENISIYDDFVRLGGDSLTAIKLLTYLDGFNISAGDVLGLRTPYAIAGSVRNISFDLDVYSLDSGCPLNEPQLNVYLDIRANDKKDAYLIPLFMNIPAGYCIEDIKSALNVMFDAHPVLGMCVSDDFDVPYLIKGSMPSIIVESNVNDDFITEFLTKPFDLYDSLSRFLIVEEEDSFVLYAVFHHIIFDAISNDVFKQDLITVLDGGVVDLDDSFLRASAFNQQIAESNDYAKAEEFYEFMLADIDDTGELLDSVLADGPGSSSINLDIDYDLLDSFLEKHNVSLNILFSSVFAYTLSRFVGSEKVSFNIVENGRDRLGNYDSLGMFVNTLPLLIDCKNQDIGSFVEYVSDLVYGVMRHNYYPFRLLAKKYDIKSDVLFQFLPDWVMDNDNSDVNIIKSVRENIDSDDGDLLDDMSDLIADLSAGIIQKGNDYLLSVVYSDKYSGAFIDRFVESYKFILNDILNFEELSDISYVSCDDLALLDAYNDTAHVLDYVDVLDAFNDNLIKYPNNILIKCEDKSYTYGESAFIINEIASMLNGCGVSRQDPVILFVPRSEWFLFASMAVLSCCCAYVPIDENYPDNYIKFMIEKCNSKTIITTDAFQKRADDIIGDIAGDFDVINVSCLENSAGSLLKLDYVDPSFDDVACIHFTSGTTGTPKGVLATRLGIYNMVEFYVDVAGFGRDDVHGVFSSLGFDVTLAMYSSIVVGGATTIVPSEVRLNIDELNKFFIRHGVTHSIISTPVAKLFCENIRDTSIKHIQAIGEKLGHIVPPKEYVLSDAYGPTETVLSITSTDVIDKIDDSSVGFINYNTKGYILDKNQNRVPCGAVGELYISGYQVSKGYINNPDESEKAFFANPFDGDIKGYERMYNTGDVVRLLPDGSIGFINRRDNQVKIRGNRVELLDIESVIREIDYVDDVTVQTVKNNGNNELAAYVVLSSDLENIELLDRVQDYVRDQKPDYMVPSYVVELDKIPLTVNGKVDKSALPKVDLNALHTEYVAPVNENEKIIVNAFEKVFNQDKIGIYDDFIRLGGDSLTAIRLLSYIEDFNINVADILSLKTPKLIAENLNKFPIDWNIYSLDEGCPLNESQLNVYLDIKANDKTDVYLIPLIMNISGRYKIDAIISALESMLDVHPILGMSVSDKEDVPYLVKGSKPLFDVVSEEVDDEFIVEFLSKPFDLSESLCRFLIVENNEDYNLFAVFHHIIFDGLSKAIFKQDLQHILEGKVVDLDDSFLKVSAFNQQITGSSDYAEAEEFYESMLADADDAGELLDSVLADGPGSTLIDLDIDNELFNSFLEKHNVSENVFFSSVFAYTLSRFVGSDNVLFNIVENGRDRFDNFDSVGMFVNTLPLLVNCKNQNIDSFMEHVSRMVYGVMRYNYYPFRLLANKYDIKSDIIFQFLTDWVIDTNDFDDTIRDDDEDDLLDGMSDLNTDLNVEIIQKGNNYLLSVVYCDKYSSVFIDRFVESYKFILNEMLNVKGLSDISYISCDDLVLLDEFNDTNHTFEYCDVLDAFNDNLEKYEDNVLVGYENKSFTFGESAFIANEIAHGLNVLGVARQDFVALFVERSEWFLLASLGVLSMGGVYVPIDTDYPDERIVLMLKDTKSKVVIVSNKSEEHMREIILDNGLDINILNVDSLNGEISSLNHLDNVSVDVDDVACVLYTSGTTGTPKGVLVSRQAINNFVLWYVNETNFTPDDVYGMHCSYVFDMHVHALYSPIVSGGSLYVVPEDIRLDLKALNDYFVEHNCTHTYITSQVGKLFAESGMETTIKLLCFGGMKLGELNAPDSIGPFESYGPSENLAISTSIFANRRIDNSSIGHFVSNVKGYVLDSERRRVPLGAVGELYLSGAQLTKGYLNREDENSKVFFDNSFDDDVGYDRIYKTGDMVRFLPDGSLGIVGRRDGQVKIRGNRVELDEVESVIRSIGFVEDVTVQTVDNDGNNELVAYVVVYDDGFEGNLREFVCDYVANRKPDYMIPSYVVELDEVPLTVNGKVDKHALPNVDFDVLRAEYVAPTNETEKHIVNIFESVFNQKNIGLYDDFVQLGGDSISAIRVSSLLEKNSIHCSARDILNYKKPYLIAQHVNENIETIHYDTMEGVVDLLPIQSYFFDQVNLNNYAQEFVLKFNVDCDRDILQKSFNELCNIHDMLRAHYKIINNNIKQEILPINSTVCNINEYNINDDLEENMRDIFVKSTQSLDIENKLLDVNLVHYDDEDYLLIVIHHLIIDGVSWHILLSDLTNIYYKLLKNERIDIVKPYPYKMWVDNVKNLVDNISDDEKQHWLSVNALLDDSLIMGPTNIFSFNVDIDFDADNLLMLSEDEYLALAISRAYKKTYNKDIIFNRESYGRDDSVAMICL